jgi:hypothetical protein
LILLSFIFPLTSVINSFGFPLLIICTFSIYGLIAETIVLMHLHNLSTLIIIIILIKGLLCVQSLYSPFEQYPSLSTDTLERTPSLHTEDLCGSSHRLTISLSNCLHYSSLAPKPSLTS